MSKHQIQPLLEYGEWAGWDAGRDGRTHLARPNSRRERAQGNINFPRLADHEQDWQPYPINPYSAKCDDHSIYIIWNLTHHDLL